MRIEEDRPIGRGHAPTELQWRSIVGNDAACDGTFYYAVRTTAVFCRPSCGSRPPLRENTSVFPSAEAARQAGYRPCKRCKPTGGRLPDEEWVASVTSYIHSRYMEPLPLSKLAEAGHGSPFHLHRTFKRVTGATPAAYVQQVRIHHAKELLINGDEAIATVGQRVGLPNAPYFITLFKKETGHTPAQYRMLRSKGED